MALCSVTAVEGESKWERGPENDVVFAFIEKLVDPRLPYKFSINDPPSEDAHKSIARQMHAVVLLYNYYHRKQKLEFKFLDFVSFCTLALSLRPTLKPFLETICGSEVVDLNGSDVHLSLTERAVKCACDIAFSLDASKDTPSVEGYPISTVAVLLVDLEKKNCMLQLDTVTEGVWSLVEKEIDVLGTDEDITAGKKRKVKDQQPLSGHAKFLQIGFDAVKDVAGIEVSDLVVLEAHVVYSLSKEKSATQFYMMECNHSFDKNKNYDLDSLVESLQGPFVEKYLDSWVTTSLVEYHRLLPYAELISSWLPRKDSVPILSDIVTEIIKNKEAQKTAKPRVENNAQDLDNSDGKDKLGYAIDVSETRRESVDKVSENNHMKGPLSGHSIRKSQRAAVDASASRKTKTATDFFNISVPSEGTEKKNARTRSDYQNKNIPSPQLDAATKTASDFFKIPVSSQGSKKMKASVRSDYQSKNVPSTQLDANDHENGVSSKAVETTDPLKSNDGRFKEQRSMGENGGTSKQSDAVVVENYSMVVHSEARNGSVTHSEDPQNALALLNSKKQQLFSRLCAIEDTLALYEHVSDRVRDAGFARQCIENIVNGKYNLLLQVENSTNSQPQKQTRNPKIYIPGISSCQVSFLLEDLEYVCVMNKWRLPRYMVQPSDGKFRANVTVDCRDNTILTSEGDAGPTPCEARESAATKMIEKLRA
ncbi:uncharacterized protein LOC121777993 isoform X2 [Salvia splendens]|uniref:uncharacterized protein LOC121777993 isoform X2 n=1 Tax=Salvia splendens TaxID=180675 RepID=UPI001C2698C0|nr:uncharacterized protein LOC121777993 isoform X2 [Salvia splendens]